MDINSHNIKVIIELKFAVILYFLSLFFCFTSILVFYIKFNCCCKIIYENSGIKVLFDDFFSDSRIILRVL